MKTSMGRRKGKDGKEEAEATAEAEVRSQLTQLDLRGNGLFLCICLTAPGNQRDFATNKSLFRKHLLPRQDLHTAASNERPM